MRCEPFRAAAAGALASDGWMSRLHGGTPKGPGEVFLAAVYAHVRARSDDRDAFYTPLISDWRNYETWREAGSPSAYDAAHRVYKERLQNYTPPPFDAERREALEAFVARRKAEGGVKTDF